MENRERAIERKQSVALASGGEPAVVEASYSTAENGFATAGCDFRATEGDSLKIMRVLISWGCERVRVMEICLWDWCFNF